MEQSSYNTNYYIMKRSFSQERQERINSDPYGIQNRASSQVSAPASKRFLNFVKGKVNEAVANFKKLIDGNPQVYTNRTADLYDSKRLLPIPHEKLNGISSLIETTISKPEYQKYYAVNTNKSSHPDKASFLNLMNFYKDVSANRIREKMEESHSLIIPEPVQCPFKPTPQYNKESNLESHDVPKKRYSRKASHGVSNNSSMADLNGKRELHSILSPKEKKRKEQKKVHFKSDLQKMKTSSSIIRYTSSDEDDLSPEEPTGKRFFTQDKTIVRKDPSLRLSMASSKKTKLNPFQRKNIVEKPSISQLARSERFAKKQYNGDFYKAIRGKLNPENSFISEYHLNDSKIETDSDESNSLPNLYEDQNFNAKRELKDSQDKQTNISEESEKASPQLNELSPKQYEEMNKFGSPLVDSYKIEEQDVEKESDFEDREIEKEKQGSPKLIEQQQESESLFVNRQNMLSPIFKQESPEVQLETASPKEEIKLLSSKNPSEEKVELEEKGSPSLALNITPSITTSDQVNIEQNILPEPVIEDLPAQKFREAEEIPEKPVLQVAEPIKINYEEALKNPIFASLNLKKSQPVETNNPFLNPVAPKSVGISSLISGNANIVQDTEPAQVQLQNTENTFLTANDNSLAASVMKPRGILDILQPSQNAGVNQAPNNVFSTVLKPVGSYSWLNQNAENQEVKPANLFSGFNSNFSQLQQSVQAQPQNNLFGQLFSSGNTNNIGINDENALVANSGSSLFSNNSPFGGGTLGNNAASSSLFGGNSSVGLDALNQSNSFAPNPFLFNTGAGSGFNSNSNQGIGSSRLDSFPIDSGKKKRNQRERAF